VSWGSLPSTALVSDLHAANGESAEGEGDGGQGEQAGDGDPDRGGVDDEGEGALVHGDGHQRLEVVGHADLLQQLGEEEVDPLPAEEDDEAGDMKEGITACQDLKISKNSS